MLELIKARKTIISFETASAFIVAFALAMGAGRTVAQARELKCHVNWSSAQVIVRKQELSRIDSLARLAKQAGLGLIVKATLCQTSKGYVYRIILCSESGRLHRRVTGAKAPFKFRRSLNRAVRKK